ncbi:MAG: hypothetical protein ABWZ82_07030 [Candidatus Limnocylindrales bacterium]
MRTHIEGQDRSEHGSLRSITLGAVLTLALGALSTAPAVAADPSPPPETPTLYADGPFGRVQGHATDVDAPRPDLLDLPVFDAWARGATVAFRPTEGTLAPWHLWVFPEPDVDMPATYQLTDVDGDASVSLQEPGLYLLRVDGTIRPDGDALEGTWWWRVAVPYRDFPPDEHGPPPPAISLASGDRVAALEQGSGCFLGTCGDIGGISPPDLLPTVTTIEHAPLSVTLEDGSGFLDWSVVVSPVGQDDAAEIVLGRAHDTRTTTAWVEAPARGDWLVATTVTYDRDRGEMAGYGRLIVEEDPGP